MRAKKNSDATCIGWTTNQATYREAALSCWPASQMLEAA